ncbi:MAG: glycosyltransferase family 4 protein [Candidatus Rokubacteria bacterium]|nr:glycosyltransferase family 4 protein [Candidatus Rokubacteria bacterium]
MRSLTILHLAANRWWTGSADPIIHLAKGLEERGHRVTLGVTPGDRFEAKARETGIALVSGLSLSVRFRPLDVLKDIVRLRRLVRDQRVDVIHTHHSHDHWLAAVAGRPPALIRTFHNVRAVKRRWPASVLYHRLDGTIAISRQIAARCREAGIPDERLWTIGGAVDLGRFTPEADGRVVRREFGLGQGPVIGSVARLAANRGHELLIRGFAKLLERVSDARLLLVGKGETLPRLRALVHELGLSEKILFSGYRDHDLPEVLASMDCFALMGAGSDESCRAALEAMAAGKPVVARRVGALPETVVDGETGILLAEDEPEAVADALLAILGDPERQRRMGKEGRRRAEAEFSPERHVSQVEQVYRTVLSRPR